VAFPSEMRLLFVDQYSANAGTLETSVGDALWADTVEVDVSQGNSDGWKRTEHGEGVASDVIG
jgi:hypothetical protein